MGDIEMLVREALTGHRREDALVAVKFGALRTPDRRLIGCDARPAVVEDAVGAIAEMVAAVDVRFVAVPEAGAETIRRARATHPVAALRIEHSLFSRGIERDILPTCRELGASVPEPAIAWVLSRHDAIVPLFGARTPEPLTEARGAADGEPTDDLEVRIERAMAAGSISGNRDEVIGMAILDGEREPAARPRAMKQVMRDS